MYYAATLLNEMQYNTIDGTEIPTSRFLIMRAVAESRTADQGSEAISNAIISSYLTNPHSHLLCEPE